MKLTDLAKLVSTNISQGRAHFDVAVYQPPEGHGCTLVSEMLVRDEAQIVEIYCGTAPKRLFSWQRKEGYECSTKGDARFSAFNAKLPDGRSIEQWYQCDIKGYDIGGTNWRLGKGNPPLFEFPADHLWQLYLNLWRLWAIHNSHLIIELMELAAEKNNVLSDCFASTPINQAHALSTIINEWLS